MTLDDCDRIFEDAFNSVTEAAFCHAVSPLFNYYEILSVDWGRGSIFWRGRTVYNELFQNLSDMNYPPPHMARVGRLNDAGSPCFYVGARKETAIAEIDAKEGQLVQLAGFRILDAQAVRLALIGEYSNIQKVGYMHFGGTDPDMVLSKILNAMPRQEALRKIYIDKFLAHVLADPSANQRNYLMSRALSQTLYARNQADGIVFPSVKDRGGFNLGIKPAAADRCLHNVCCIVVRLGRRRRFGLLDFEVVKSAKMLDADLNFVWDDSLVGDRIGLYGMSKEEFELARNSLDEKNALLNVLHSNRSRHQQ